MELEEIKAAVDAGKLVHWSNAAYTVHPDQLGGYLVTYRRGHSSANSVGLTTRAGDLVGQPEQFFLGDPDA